LKVQVVLHGLKPVVGPGLTDGPGGGKHEWKAKPRGLSTARKSGEDRGGDRGETGERHLHVAPGLRRPKAQNASDQGRQAGRGVTWLTNLHFHSHPLRTCRSTLSQPQ
jgi:hypothetical protein